MSKIEPICSISLSTARKMPSFLIEKELKRLGHDTTQYTSKEMTDLFVSHFTPKRDTKIEQHCMDFSMQKYHYECSFGETVTIWILKFFYRLIVNQFFFYTTCSEKPLGSWVKVPCVTFFINIKQFSGASRQKHNILLIFNVIVVTFFSPKPYFSRPKIGKKKKKVPLYKFFLT